MLLPFLAVFLISCALLSYEILLIRILSIINWGHYAYMAVSLGMLGLGFSGVLVALKEKFFRRHRNISILAGCFLFGALLPLCFVISYRVPANYLHLIWDARQFFYLTAQFFLYGVPFLAASTVIALFFTYDKEKTGHIYAWNLTGSAAGVLAAIITMYLVPPENYIFVPALFSSAAGLFWGLRLFKKRKKKMLVFAATAILLTINLLFAPDSLLTYVCQYKGLPGLLRIPGTEKTASFHSPLGFIHITEGRTIRLAPAMSLGFTGILPEQKALTVDAGFPVPVYSLDNKDFGFLDYSLFAAGYHVVKNPDVLLIGAGGGSDVILANYHKSQRITVVEIDPLILAAAEKASGGKKQNPMSLADRIIIKDARGFLEHSGEKFDLVIMNPAGSMAASAAGVYSQNEDYLNTVESFRLMYRSLLPEGVFSVSKWVKTPPRDGIKIFATAFTALKQEGVESPEEHLAMIRNWDAVTLLVKKSPFTLIDKDNLRNFSFSGRNFDISFLPGLRESETNRYHRLPEETYYLAAKSIAENQDMTGRFFMEYPFNLEPATDNKPYFSNFIRWKAIPHLFRTMRRDWIPFAEHGNFSLLATFLQAIIFGFLLIIMPLKFKLKKDRKLGLPEQCRLKTYFSLLGFSYITLEIVLMQKFILFLHHPIYSASAVISSFLLMSGAGSYFSGKFLGDKKNISIIPFAGIIFFGTFMLMGIDKIFAMLSWAPVWLRFIFSFALISPLAFFMGMPFPFGMKKALSDGERGAGCAWGHNGFFSVAGAIATPIISGIAGFTAAGAAACLGYLSAMALWIRTNR